jgi:hypothetical protein
VRRVPFPQACVRFPPALRPRAREPRPWLVAAPARLRFRRDQGFRPSAGSGKLRAEADHVNGWTIGYGAALVAVGVGGFVATGSTHKTALIPAGFGAAEIALGLLGARRAATVVGVVALAGAARGLKKLPALLRGEAVERPAAVAAQSLMAGLSAAYVAGSLLAG